MSTFERYDHEFHTIGLLDKAPDDPVLGGDDSTWGEGGATLFEIDVLTPTLGASGQTVLHIAGQTLTFDDWDVDYADVAYFLRTAANTKLSDDQVDFILWTISGTCLGERNGKSSRFDIDEWPLSDLEETVGTNLEGRMIVHSNTRYDCVTSLKDGGAVWEDETDPDDDAQSVSVFSL